MNEFQILPRKGFRLFRRQRQIKCLFYLCAQPNGLIGYAENNLLKFRLGDLLSHGNLPKVDNLLGETGGEVGTATPLGKSQAQAQTRIGHQAGLHHVGTRNADFMESRLESAIVQQCDAHGFIIGQPIGK